MKAFRTAAAAGATPPVIASATRVPGQKKSCDLCVFRKRKCDGAMPTCGFCLSRGSECHYSLRRPNRPRGYARHPDGGDGQRAVKMEGTTEVWRAPDEEESCEVKQEEAESSPIGWKRVHLSASPATGLVGTRENAFLGSYFSCLGFLPLTHESLIREAMLEILLASPSTPGILRQSPTEDLIAPKAEESSRAWGGDQEQGGGDAASACTLWCTIAMGALVQGQPPYQISPYMHLAWTSFSQCSGTVTVESGRAFLMMAYLCNFMGDDKNFGRYLQLARKVVNRLSENTLQKQEIDDLVTAGDDTRIFYTDALEHGELDAYSTDEGPALEVPDVILKSDLWRLPLEASRRLMKAFLRDHRAQNAVPAEGRKHCAYCVDGTKGSANERQRAHDQECHKCQRLKESAGQRPHAKGGGERYISGMSITIESNKTGEEATPSRPGSETWKCTEEAWMIFARLRQVAEAPEMRGGVGSLLYNSILGYLGMVTGSAEVVASREKVKHCVGIISRYPGLCRFSTWRHLSHCLLGFLSELNDGGLFEQLRQVYNSVLAEDAAEVPPHAEWTMIGFCDHIFCRSMDRLGNDWGGLSAAQSLTSGGSEDNRRLSGEAHWLHDTRENNSHWASLAPENHSAPAVPDQTFPTHEWTDIMPPDFAHSHYGYTAPNQGFPAAESLPMAFGDPVLSMAGHTPVMTQIRRANDDASTPAVDHVHSGWNSLVPAAGARASWPHQSSLATAGSEHMSASHAYQLFGERVVHAAEGGELYSSRATSNSTSDSSWEESSNDGTTDQTANSFVWRTQASSNF